MMDTVAKCVESLSIGHRQDPLVCQTIAAVEEMRIDETRERLLSRMAIKRAKPYLHAVETEELEDASYEQVLADVRPVEPRLGTVYLHIPFCVKRCAHCHYYKELGVAEDVVKGFPAYLAKELAMVVKAYGWDKVSTRSIHYGGGTPSLLPIAQWRELFSEVGRLVRIEPDDEVTIECSPEDVTKEKLAFWRDNGVNRISLGTQSFSEDQLKILNRNHHAELSARSYCDTVDAGFENVNLDLMYGMPGRTFASWLGDIHKILSLMPESVTVYATRPDPADTLERFERFPGDGERIFGHLLALNAFLSAGYIQYSPNQFIRSYKGACAAKRERNQCHNVLGIGPLAHSIMKNWFYYNKANLDRYQETMDRDELCELKGAKMSLEAEKVRFMQFGLKLSGINKPATDNGVLKAEYQEKFGETIEERFGDKMAFLRGEQLLAGDNGNLHLTKAGVLLNRDVVRYFAMASEG